MQCGGICRVAPVLELEGNKESIGLRMKISRPGPKNRIKCHAGGGERRKRV